MNYKGSINLMQLMGAQVVSMEVGGKQRNVVAIPVEWNDIFVSADRDGKPTGAYLALRAWTVGEKYKQACIANNADKEDYMPPTHQLQVSYRQEFQDAAEKAVVARLRKDKKYMAQKPSEDGIKKQARIEVSNKSRVGTLTPLERKPATPFTGQAAQAAYAPASPLPADASNHAVPAEDDLPF